MSLYLKLVIGPVIVCDIELFATQPDTADDEPPPQLAGGSGTVLYPDQVEDVFGFGGR